MTNSIPRPHPQQRQDNQGLWQDDNGEGGWDRQDRRLSEHSSDGEHGDGEELGMTGWGGEQSSPERHAHSSQAHAAMPQAVEAAESVLTTSISSMLTRLVARMHFRKYTNAIAMLLNAPTL